MGICVYWRNDDKTADVAEFSSKEMTAALTFCQEKRREGKTHVCISSELEESVGKPGVDEVVGGVLPSGEKYDWDKNHRANPQPGDVLYGGPKKGFANKVQGGEG